MRGRPIKRTLRQADALKMRLGIGEDTCMKHPLEHRCARGAPST